MRQLAERQWLPRRRIESRKKEHGLTNDPQYTAAVKSQSLDSVAKALSKLDAVFKSDAKLGTIMQAPTLSAEDKSAIVAELQKHTGPADKTIKNFLETLAENNRLSILQSVCAKFETLMGASRGEIELTVISATVSTRIIPQLEEG